MFRYLDICFSVLLVSTSEAQLIISLWMLNSKIHRLLLSPLSLTRSLGLIKNLIVSAPLSASVTILSPNLWTCQPRRAQQQRKKTQKMNEKEKKERKQNPAASMELLSSSVVLNKQTLAHAKFRMHNLFHTLTLLMNKYTVWSLAPAVSLTHRAQHTATQTNQENAETWLYTIALKFVMFSCRDNK